MWLNFVSFMSSVLIITGVLTWVLGDLIESDFVYYIGIAMMIIGAILYLGIVLYIKVKGYREVYCGNYNTYLITH